MSYYRIRYTENSRVKMNVSSFAVETIVLVNNIFFYDIIRRDLLYCKYFFFLPRIEKLSYFVSFSHTQYAQGGVCNVEENFRYTTRYTSTAQNLVLIPNRKKGVVRNILTLSL